MNSVKMGQPKEFYRNSGCIIISNGCPCPPIVANEILPGSAPPVMLVPGSVNNIRVEYGSVIVRWDAPTAGGIPTSYIVSATRLPDGPTIDITTDAMTTMYTFVTGTLIPGDEYQMSVIGVNEIGNGLSPAALPLPISAPYGQPLISSVAQNGQFDQLEITVNFLTRPAFNLTSSTTFNIFAYINGVLQTPSPYLDYTSIITPPYDAIITVSGLTQSPYTFKIQIVNANDYSSISSQSTPAIAPTTPPAAPTSIQLGLSFYNSQSIVFSSSDTVTGALISGGTYSYTNLQPGFFSQTYTLTITGLTQGTPYSGLTLQVDTPNGISSAATIPPFTTTLLVITGAGQTLPGTTLNNEYNSPIKISYNPVGGGSFGGEFIPSVGTLYVPGQGNWNGTPLPDENYTNFTLPILGIYDNCYIILSNNEGISTQPSNTFTIQIGTPLPPSDIRIEASSSTTQSILFNTYTTQLTGASISNGAYNYTNLAQDGLTITGLVAGVTYNLTLLVINANGESTTVSIPPFTIPT
jgi:hypothetical protein